MDRKTYSDPGRNFGGTRQKNSDSEKMLMFFSLLYFTAINTSQNYPVSDGLQEKEENFGQIVRAPLPVTKERGSN
jgi:hypothetical protein